MSVLKSIRAVENMFHALCHNQHNEATMLCAFGAHRESVVYVSFSALTRIEVTIFGYRFVE